MGFVFVVPFLFIILFVKQRHGEKYDMIVGRYVMFSCICPFPCVLIFCLFRLAGYAEMSPWKQDTWYAKKEGDLSEQKIYECVPPICISSPELILISPHTPSNILYKGCRVEQVTSPSSLSLSPFLSPGRESMITHEPIYCCRAFHLCVVVHVVNLLLRQPETLVFHSLKKLIIKRAKIM